MNYKPLSAVSVISHGQTFRGRAESSGRVSDIKLVMIRDVTGQIIKDTESLAYAELELDKLKVQITKGDILFPTRGGRLCASLFDADDGNLVTTTNHMSIIKANQNIILPMYLYIVLNMPDLLAKLTYESKGSTVPILQAKHLGALEIPCPLMDRQKKIVGIYTEMQEQIFLMKKLDDINKKIITNMIYGELL